MDGCDDECSDIHGKEFPGQSKFHLEYNRSHTEENVRHICEISGRTGCDLGIGNNLVGKNIHGNICSLIGDETIIKLQRARVYVFSDSVLCLWKAPSSILKSNECLEGQNRMDHNLLNSYRDYDGIEWRADWSSSGTFFPGFTTLQLYGKVKKLLYRLGETPETFTGEILFMSMFNDISCYNERQWRRMFGKC